MLTHRQIFMRTAVFSVAALAIIYATAGKAFAMDLPQLPEPPQISAEPEHTTPESFPNVDSSSTSSAETTIPEGTSSTPLETESNVEAVPDVGGVETPTEELPPTDGEQPSEMLPPEDVPAASTLESDIASIRDSLHLFVYFICPFAFAFLLLYLFIKWFNDTFVEEHFL